MLTKEEVNDMIEFKQTHCKLTILGLFDILRQIN